MPTGPMKANSFIEFYEHFPGFCLISLENRQGKCPGLSLFIAVETKIQGLIPIQNEGRKGPQVRPSLLILNPVFWLP